MVLSHSRDILISSPHVIDLVLLFRYLDSSITFIKSDVLKNVL